MNMSNLSESMPNLSYSLYQEGEKDRQHAQEQQSSMSHSVADLRSLSKQQMSIHTLSTRPQRSSDAADGATSSVQTSNIDSTSILPSKEAEGECNDAAPSAAECHAELVRRIRSIFALGEEEELVSCHPCWLFRSVLLQGYLYVMTSHVCFYASLPSRQDKVLYTGPLRKRTRRTHRFSKHWAVLRGRALSWYESERDPYFPQDQIDLRDVQEVGVAPFDEVQTSKASMLEWRFVVRTSYRTFLFEVDNQMSRDAWISSIDKAAFRAQNEGESVRIAIPFETILDIDSSIANPNAGHTSKAEQEEGLQDVALVAIKVIQSTPGDSEFTMDEYFFTNMADEAQFLLMLRDKLLLYAQSQQQHLNRVRASIGAAMSISGKYPSVASLRRSSSQKGGNLTPTLPLRPESDHRQLSSSDLQDELAEAAAVDTLPSTGSTTDASLSSSVRTIQALEQAGYPPSPQGGASTHLSKSTLSSGSFVGDRRRMIPQWLREASSKVASNASDNLQALASRFPRRAIRETWSKHVGQPGLSTVNALSPDAGAPEEDEPTSHADNELASSMHSAYSILEAEQVEADDDLKEQDFKDQFRRYFSLPDAEKLIEHTSASLYRVLPVAGRLFVSTNYVCFRSSRLATKTMGQTLMILPRKEIISLARNTAVQYGRHGLVIIVRGHEELFLEFPSPQRRDQCIALIELQADEAGSRDDQVDEKLMLGERLTLSREVTDPISPLANLNESLSHCQKSPSRLDSSTSSFMPNRPRDDLHFTFLTVGSRGDVQPYIALACGLKREGHRVRIATHGEFGKWIQSFGIEFREVGGDPAELMRICIENGTFTLAFVRESVTKFRGWLDDLLVSCWEACQGTDVIIESPSALAGIHIAEALRVPYFRAFTMPWTRTRAYPHAFAVPSRRAGGNYNYMSYVIFDQVLWRSAAGQINAWRKRCMHLHPTNLQALAQHQVPFLYNFSPNLVAKPLDWSDWIHVTGFWFLDNADETGATTAWTPPDDLLHFIQETKQLNRKLVYIGWGSILIADADAVLQTVVDAIRKSGVRAIISRGWSDRLKRGPQPDRTAAERESALDDDVWRDIFTVQSVPHDWLFPQLDAACHHGGSGTLGASLRAGVPTIVRPFFGDQFFWASQVESLQIGANVANPFNAERFAAALSACTTDERMKQRARRMADAIAKEDGVSTAIRAIYSDWDYACSRLTQYDAKSHTAAHSTSDAVHLAEEANEAILQDGPLGTSDDEDQSMDEWSVVSGSEEGVALAPI